MTYRIMMRRGSAAEWLAKNPILWPGEPGYEKETGKFKVGDGVSTWKQLSYFTPGTKTASNVSVGTELYDHVTSEEPHPAYDDGPSLLLLYENAKV